MYINSEIKSELAPHQLLALEAIMQNDRGKIIYPTGTGKTRIEAAVIACNVTSNPNAQIHIVHVPRILLSYQILTEVYSFLNKFDIRAKYLLVHSGTSVNEEELLKLRSSNLSGFWVDIDVTTQMDVIERNINHSKNLNVPLIIIQTYDSADRTFNTLTNMGIVASTVQNDECQYLVSSEFVHLLRVDSEKFYSYTATQKNAHLIGMNNETLWGPELAKMTPREAIDLGIIVRPRLIYQASQISVSKEDARKSFPIFVESDWDVLNRVNSGVKNKLLVKTRGTDDMSIFINSKECKRFVESGVHVFVISSNKKVKNWYNGKVYNRTNWLKELQSVGADAESEMIVLHFDILSEGIDVPGFTSISFFSTPELDKFIQNYGRTARLDVSDRKSLQNGDITTSDLKSWKKPFSYIILHEFNDLDTSQSEGISQLVFNMRQYGFDPKRDVIISTNRGIFDGEDMENLLENDDIRKIQGKLIDKYELYFRAESEKDARLSVESSDQTLEQLNQYFLDLFG
jgi:superfamily II DNA or RNA helicase